MPLAPGSSAHLPTADPSLSALTTPPPPPPTPQEGAIYARSQLAVNDLEAQFGALWTQCQRCQGSLHQDVLCRSRDCPIFYRRMKVQKELGEAQAVVQRFAEQDW